MASFGLKYPYFAPIASEPENALPTYATAGAELVGKAIEANLAVTFAEGQLHADNELAEELREFVSGALTMQIDRVEDDIASLVYGATVTDGALIDSTADSPPLGGLGYIKTELRDNVRKYRAFFYPKVKASIGNDNAVTKGSSITFQTETTTFTIFAAKNGQWRHREVLDTEAAAVAWIESMFAGGGTP